MNEQEKGIIEDTIKSIKALVDIAMGEIADNICSTIEKKYNRFRYVLDLGEDTIKELEKIKNGEYSNDRSNTIKR